MPTITIIDGVKIEVYPGDHNPPHFHATYGEYEVLIVIKSGKIYAGDLPAKQLKKVLAWGKENKQLLLEKFKYYNP